MSFDYQRLCKEIETADPTIHVEIWFDDGSEIIFTRDKTRTCQQQFKLNDASGGVGPHNAAARVLEYWRKSRIRHPESYMTCSCHAHVNPIARSWHNPPVESKSAICLCGIDRQDCDYHK
jgi:hypothetical protein